MALTSTQKRIRLKKRVRKNIFGTDSKPRLTVYKSNKDIYVQLIDDNAGKTLAFASSREKGVAGSKGSKTEISALVGKKIAEKAKKAGVETIVFDRNGFIYQGRIQALADAAREGGLKF